MEQSETREHLTAFLRSCSAADMAFLRRHLLRRNSQALLRHNMRISPQELLAVESRFREHAAAARGPRERLPRLRMWLIFILLRYGGLRLFEIFALSPEDLDLQACVVRVSGVYAREVPLPHTVSRRLRSVLENPVLYPVNGNLAHCDASYVRRSLQECGAACGLPKGLLSARTLRYSRAVELGRQGIPLSVVDIFLGRRANAGRRCIMRCDPREAWNLLREQLQRELPVKTSARNVFQGRIISLRQDGLLVEAVLGTAGGLSVRALITDESCRNLAISEGMLVNASVKAPWIMLLPGKIHEGGSAANPSGLGENCFPGFVEQVREDATAREVLVALSEGSQVCALLSKGPSEDKPLRAGDTVTVLFKAFSVILSLD
ncbi:hypothetical protein AGMMS49925_04080 [Deltaproteobacteria bacterium]|nr:hypothetical protein AGMMS49925_04080 [Deltaproteobacteria bacterium]